MLSGIWYDLRWQLENYAWGPGTQAESALDYARRIFVSWTMIASVLDSSAGNGGLPVADDLTAITVLTVDDAIDFDGVGNSIGGDGIVSNGTPHEDAICNAFQELHGVPCGHANVLAYSEDYRCFHVSAESSLAPDEPFAIRIRGRATTLLDDPDVSCVGNGLTPISWLFVNTSGALGSIDVYQTSEVWGTVAVRDPRVVPGGAYDVAFYRQSDDLETDPPFARSAVRMQPLGDANRDGIVATTLDDILCALSGFNGYWNCPGADVAPFSCPGAGVECHSNGIINLDDLLVLLNSFGGAIPCPDPC